MRMVKSFCCCCFFPWKHNRNEPQSSINEFLSYSNVNIELKHTTVWTHSIEQSVSGSPFIPFTSAETSLVKSRLKNTQKRLYVNLKIANFLQWPLPPWPPAAGRQCWILITFSSLPPSLSKFLRTLLARSAKKC